MKKFVLISVLICGITFSTAAQEKGTLTAGIETQIWLAYKSDVQAVEICVDLGYNFTSWLSAGVRSETTIGLFQYDGYRDHQVCDALGGFARFNLLTLSDNSLLSFKTSVGATIGSDSWKYTYYSGGVYLDWIEGRITPLVGLGVKYYDSHNTIIDNFFRVFVTFGFKW